MYNVDNICVFHVDTINQTSGERIVTDADGLIDINEFHSALNHADKIVRLCLHLSGKNKIREQYFDCVAKLNRDKDTYVFSHFGRNVTAPIIVKMVMEFNDFDEEPYIHIQFFSE